MIKIIKKIKNQDIKDVYDYFKISKEINDYIKNNNLSQEKRIKIAILSSSTFKGIEDVLRVKCFEEGIIADFYSSNYNQYSQDIYNDESELYNFSPNLIILFIDVMSLLGDRYFDFYQLFEKNRHDFIQEKENDIKLMILKLRKKTSANILIHSFSIPVISSMGILENKQVYGIREAVEEINNTLRNLAKKDNKLFLFDFNAFCNFHGTNNLFNYKMYYLGDIKINLKFLPKLGEEYMAYIKPLMSLTRKCLVLDLDNTLWGGVIGEDGINNIKLGPNPEGRSFLEFQKYIKALYHRGVILAINSKNNKEDVMEVFNKHPYMVLGEDCFASLQINWSDKATNIRNIAKELNIGLDSIIFIDDDKLNREIVKNELPEVEVVDLPVDSSLYLKTISELNDFNILQITEEDNKKGEMYAQQKKRRNLSEEFTNVEDYLKKLEMVVKITRVNDYSISRISQLTQKTNQFNMTTRRYLEHDIKNMLKEGYLILSIDVKDKFGDNGITGVAIIDRSESIFRVDNFILSCRVIGRNIEKVLLSYIVQKAKEENVVKIIGEFIQNEKNHPAKDFYNEQGFKKIEKKGDVEIWHYINKNNLPNIDYIKIIKE